MKPVCLGRLLRLESLMIWRGASAWLGVLTVAGQAFAVARSGRSNPWLLAEGMAQWPLIAVALILLPSLGSVRRRDGTAGADELTWSRPAPGAVRIAASYCASLGASGAVVLAGLAALPIFGVLFGSDLASQAPAAVGGALLLILPSLAFFVSLALLVDVISGHPGAVLAAGTAVALGSLLYHPALQVSNLVPMFVPRYVSPVFGYGPFSGVLLANKCWALALAAAAVGLAILLLPLRSPALPSGSGSHLALALLVLAVLAGGLSLPSLLRAPRPGQWASAAVPWELEQLRMALAGDARSAGRWERHSLRVGRRDVVVWLARGEAGAAAPLAEAAAALVPFFPMLDPAAGPLRIVQGGHLLAAREVSGVLVFLEKDTLLAGKGHAMRTLLRGMADAVWRVLTDEGGTAVDAGRPWVCPWATSASLYNQWAVMAEAGLAAELEAELELWRAATGPRPAEGWGGEDQGLWGSGAAGLYLTYDPVRQALALWDAAGAPAAGSVLDALRQGRSAVEVTLLPPGGPQAAEVFWRIVGGELGLDVEMLPGWPAGKVDR